MPEPTRNRYTIFYISMYHLVCVNITFIQIF